jgi:hemerythrin-like domain-containing protein
MDTFDKNIHLTVGTHTGPRREFLKNGIILSTITGVAGLNLLKGCKEETGEDISPSEDLMREHGLLNRILLIYDTCKLHLINVEPFPLDALLNSALIIRSFIEEYHEKLEEDFLFPRFIKANHLVDLVKVLKYQHNAGRNITEQIINFGKMPDLIDMGDKQKLIKLLDDFDRMYRPHEAREDTVLFPEVRKIISRNEYFALGEDFEKKEHELFGENGFETMVEKVADIEKQLEIYELTKFTPDLNA